MHNTATPNDEERIADARGRTFIAKKHAFPANAKGFLLAPVLWFVYFLAVYSLQGAGCAMIDPGPAGGAGALRITLALLTAAVAAAIVAQGIWSYRSWKRLPHASESETAHPHAHAGFLAHGSLLHAALFFVATLWIGIPILLIGPCDMVGST